MAPEQAAGRHDAIDERTDVFALGGVLYYILTGRPPHRGPNLDITLARAAAGVVEPPESVAPECPPPTRLSQIAMKALAKDPEDRYPDVRSLHLDVRRFVHGADFFDKRLLQPGEVVMRQGEQGDEAYLITRGTVRVYTTTGGEETEIDRLGPGDVFGEAAIFSGYQRTASIQAVEETHVAVVTQEALGQDLATSHILAPFVRALADHFGDLSAEATELRSDKRRRAVAEETLRHMCFHSRPQGDGRLVAAWSPLRDRIAERLDLGPEAIVNAVAAVGGVQVDPASDAVVLAPT
jgi:CRP-like cAMP-binding protein